MAKFTNEQIITEIEIVKKSIDELLKSINLHAVWLFVATLSCWSIDNPDIRAFSIWLVILLFIIEAFDGGKDLSSHKKKLMS